MRAMLHPDAVPERTGDAGPSARGPTAASDAQAESDPQAESLGKGSAEGTEFVLSAPGVQSKELGVALSRTVGPTVAAPDAWPEGTAGAGA
jgi:hypothetical protein